MRLNGEQLGFIPAHVSRGNDSSGLASRMDRGDRYDCRISDLTGGGTKTFGVNIEITEVGTEQPRSDEVASVPPKTDAQPSGGNRAWLLALAVIVIAIVALLLTLK